MEDFDVIVLGAGPAGAAAAFRARAGGLKTALIDRAAFPRDKLCGGGVTGRALKALDDIFGGFPDVPYTDCHAVRILSGKTILGQHDHAPLIRMIMRRDFDAALREKAIAAGAIPFTGKAKMVEGGIRLGDQLLRGKTIIGADGAKSEVARSLYGSRQGRMSLALEVESQVLPSGPAMAELDFSGAHYGYGWAFPKEKTVTLGIGGLEDKNPNLRRDFDLWLQERGLNGLKIKGHHIPFGGKDFGRGRGATILAGDAAGFADPVTGEGIAWALISGQLAAEAAIKALAEGHPERLYQYYDATSAYITQELQRARILGYLMHHPWLHQRFLRYLAQSPSGQMRFLQLVAGEADYRDFTFKRLFGLFKRVVTGHAGAQ